MTHETQFKLLTTRRFLPLFVTQFLGAFNDNAFRNALLILITYRVAQKAGLDRQILVTLAGGLFILPFFLFSATAGQLADRLEKARLIRMVKICEIVVMGLAAAGFFMTNVPTLLTWSVPVLFTVLFLMGAQSAFFGPLKYSILPDHLRDSELIGGNGLIDAGTFLAILLGTIVGGLVILTDQGLLLASVIVIGMAAAGWAGSLFIPRAGPAAPGLRINPNILGETWGIIHHAAQKRDVFLSILGIAWFWLVGFTYLTQFPTYTKDILGADEQVVTLFLTTFSIGVGIGSLLCNRALKGEINAKYVPLSALGVTVFSVDLYLASGHGVGVAGGSSLGVGAFLASPGNWRILIDQLLISFCGGFYVVPLYAILQSRSDESHRSRTIAANNIIGALFMVAGALAAGIMLKLGFTVTHVFLAVAIANAGVAAYICKLLPDEAVRAIAGWLLRLAYRVEVKGLDNYRKAGARAVIVANHTSFLDAALIGAFLPETPTFVVNTFIARKWWLKPAFAVFDLLPIDPTNPMAAKTLVQAVKQGRKCVIFPEGRITVTGALMKIYEGPGMIADLAEATLLPIRIEGAQYTPFSRLKGKIRLRWFPKISMTILEPRRFEVPKDIKGRQRRRIISARLYDVMAGMVFETSDVNRTLFKSLVDARALHGGQHPVVEDVERRPVTYNRLITASFVLGRKLSRNTRPGENIGVLLPNSVGTVVIFFALQAYGRVPAMLNFSTGLNNMITACQTARIRTVLTSRRFIEAARFEETAETLPRHVQVIYLEDLQDSVGPLDKLFGLVAGRLAGFVHRRASANMTPRDPAVVLFTSGSEGTPKGVVLSHVNIQANRYQLSARIDFNPSDIVFNALPVFHSFGLTGGLLLPLLSGVKTFLYPSPLHYRIVPELVYDSNATILFGTNTFLSGYARCAHPYDFYSVRYIFAGAEKVTEETRRTWSENFGLRILEGYGATETSPVLATNTPMQFKAGTVGCFLPGIHYRLVEVPGLERGGRLEVSGPNIMLGYLRAERPGELEAPTDGWYDTGDIVEVDEDGYVTIVGRAKRFAKIAGEMVSLTAVEAQVSALWPDHNHAVVSIPDARKGEQLVLVTENQDAHPETLLAYAKREGIVELMIPKTIHVVDEVPVLATGKVDYVGVQKLLQ